MHAPSAHEPADDDLNVPGQGSIETTIPLVSRGMPAASLLELAKVNLRCIDFENMSLELLSGIICGAKPDEDSPEPSPTPPPGKKGATKGGRRHTLVNLTHAEDCSSPSASRSGNSLTSGSSLVSAELYNLSRPVKPGEVVDFFMSHSWHDDPIEKWQKLQRLADTFFKVHSRYPTFWLDKVCINQKNIAEGLKVLPVNVMACKQMLVLCGPTYPERLWCAWELCTMFSFMDMEAALKRIVVTTINRTNPVNGQYAPEDPANDPLSKLESFSILACRCYDPNEEAVLKRIIKTVGVEYFNRRLRSLATGCRKYGVESMPKHT